MRAKAVWIEDRAPDADVLDINVTNEAPESPDGRWVAIVEGVACGPQDMTGEILVYDVPAFRLMRAMGFNVKRAVRE